MKKIFLGSIGVLVLAFVIVLFINARESSKGTDKVKTEIKAESAKGSCTMQCNHMKDNTAKSCEPANCRKTACDPEKCKNSGCDPENCKGNCEKACNKVKSCERAACAKK